MESCKERIWHVSLWAVQKQQTCLTYGGMTELKCILSDTTEHHRDMAYFLSAYFPHFKKIKIKIVL
jgi:hypothetical protein